MPKRLVIVESPAKAKTIAKYLGSDFEVLASVGHIRDLAEAKDIPFYLSMWYLPVSPKRLAT